MSTLPRIRTEYGEGIGVELFFGFPNIQGNEQTYLEENIAAGVTSLPANGLNLSGYIIIGRPGSEKTEIRLISGTPTSTAIVVTVATSFAHARGTPITFIPFNQIVPERSTNGGTSYSALSAIDMRPDATETYLQRPSDTSTDYYKYRFYNASDATYSAYSDPVIATGLGDNTRGAVKHRALDQIGEEVDPDGLITDSFLDESIMEARRIADQNPAVFRWSFRTQFGVVLGQIYAGQWRIAAPTDLRDRNSPKNVLGLYFGGEHMTVTYQDRQRFNQHYLNVVHTTVATAALEGASSLVLSSTADFEDTGTIYVAGEDADDESIAIDYTANNRTTNTLTVTAADVTRNISSATDVWQRATFGRPTYYSIHDGYLYFDVPLEDDSKGRAMKGDYYKSIPTMNSDADEFDEPFYDLYVAYLKWKIKYKKANGKIDRDADPDWKDWINGIATLIAQEFPAQSIQFIPDVHGWAGEGE